MKETWTRREVISVTAAALTGLYFFDRFVGSNRNPFIQEDSVLSASAEQFEAIPSLDIRARFRSENLPPWRSELTHISERIPLELQQQAQENMFMYASPQWHDVHSLFHYSASELTHFSYEDSWNILEDRRAMMDKYYRRYYSFLNETPSAAQRVHIDFPKVIHDSDQHKKELQSLDEHFESYDPIQDHPQIRNLITLLKNGYHVKSLMLGNPAEFVQGKDLGEELQGFDIYRPVRQGRDPESNEGFDYHDKIADQYERVMNIIQQEVELQPGQLSFIYGNETDIVNFHYQHARNNHVSLDETPIISPYEYWYDYYTLARRLQQRGMNLLPHAMAMEWNGEEIQDDVWIRARLQAKLDLGIDDSELDDRFRLNIYGDNVQHFKAKKEKREQQIKALNPSDEIVGIQEWGIMPWGTDKKGYFDKKTQRIKVLKDVLNYFSGLQLKECGIFAMPLESSQLYAGELWPQIEKALSTYESGYDGKHNMYIHESKPGDNLSLWSIIKKHIHAQVFGN